MGNMQCARHDSTDVASTTVGLVGTGVFKDLGRTLPDRPTDGVGGSAASGLASAPCWSVQQLAALAASFLEECSGLQAARADIDKLGILKRVMRFHFDEDWSDGEILALEGLMLYYRCQLLNAQLSVGDRVEILKRIYTDVPADWMEAEIVQLHFLLLDECRALADPRCPLAEKLDIVRWMFAQDRHGNAAFSFRRCARMAWGCCDVASVQEDLAALVRGWLQASIQQYPEQVRVWVAQRLSQDASWLADRLEKNPQLINELTQRLRRQPDLFE